MVNLALGGNPNCGKSVLFNRLTGIRQHTGNWPGVTVERKEGRCKLAGYEATLVDLPGIYTLDTMSLDEQISRDYLLSGNVDVVINVIDASRLERNLYLTMQLLEMDVPMVVALNMMDVARKRGMALDLDRLSLQLGCPVVAVVATTGEGLDALRCQVRQVAIEAIPRHFELHYPEPVEQAIERLIPKLQASALAVRARWQAIKLLEADEQCMARLDPQIRGQVVQLRADVTGASGEECDILIADARFGQAHEVASQVIRHQGRLGRTVTDRIDHLVLHPLLGIPVFLLVMYLMFMFSINIGGALIGVFDGVARALLVDGAGVWLQGADLPQWLIVLLANGVGGGIEVVATFIPIIATLYLFLSLLEDSGYMARAAFVMDRMMRTVGLPGRAFVPLIVGFGCNVPAIMATRTLHNERERKLTILMNPFMSCSARLPVYALFVAAFFPVNGQNVVFALYLIGIAIAIGTGLIMKRTLLSGTSTGFIMELPPYHLPALRSLLLHSWDRVRSFVLDAGKIIIVMVVILNGLNSLGTDGSFGHQGSENSLLSSIGKTLTPVFSPLGIKQDNWPATVGIFSGIMAKEVVVGTLNALYTQHHATGPDAVDGARDFSLLDELRAALETVPANFAQLSETVLDPFGMEVEAGSSTASVAQRQGVRASVFAAMLERFDGRAGAFAYLLFILLYFPCVATLSAIAREAGRAWAGFVATWTSGVAYLVATVFYQAASYAEHPQYSMAWIGGAGLLAVVAFMALRWWNLAGGQRLSTTQVRA